MGQSMSGPRLRLPVIGSRVALLATVMSLALALVVTAVGSPGGRSGPMGSRSTGSPPRPTPSMATWLPPATG